MMGDSNYSNSLSGLEAEQWAALSDPIRIRLIYTIWEQPESVSNLASKLGMSDTITSRHLRILHNRNLVKAVRNGAFKKYHLTDQRIVDALNLLKESFHLAEAT